MNAIRRIKLKRKEYQYTISDLNRGTECFDEFIKLNKQYIKTMKEKEKDYYIYMAGFCAGCEFHSQRKK